MVGVKYIVDPDMATVNSITPTGNSSELASGRKAEALSSKSKSQNTPCDGVTVVRIEWPAELEQFYRSMGMSDMRIARIKARYTVRNERCATTDPATFKRITTEGSIDRELGMAGLSSVLPARRERYLREHCAHNAGGAVCRRVRAFDARRLARHLRRKNRVAATQGTVRCEGASCWYDITDDDEAAPEDDMEPTVMAAALRSSVQHTAGTPFTALIAITAAACAALSAGAALVITNARRATADAAVSHNMHNGVEPQWMSRAQCTMPHRHSRRSARLASTSSPP